MSLESVFIEQVFQQLKAVEAAVNRQQHYGQMLLEISNKQRDMQKVLEQLSPKQFDFNLATEVKDDEQPEIQEQPVEQEIVPDSLLVKPETFKSYLPSSQKVEPLRNCTKEYKERHIDYLKRMVGNIPLYAEIISLRNTGISYDDIFTANITVMYEHHIFKTRTIENTIRAAKSAGWIKLVNKQWTLVGDRAPIEALERL